MFSLIYAWINGWVNNGEAGDLRRCRVHYDVIVMTNLIDNKCRMQIMKIYHIVIEFVTTYIQQLQNKSF